MDWFNEHVTEILFVAQNTPEFLILIAVVFLVGCLCVATVFRYYTRKLRQSLHDTSTRLEAETKAKDAIISSYRTAVRTACYTGKPYGDDAEAVRDLMSLYEEDRTALAELVAALPFHGSEFRMLGAGSTLPGLRAFRHTLFEVLKRENFSKHKFIVEDLGNRDANEFLVRQNRGRLREGAESYAKALATDIRP